MSGIPDFTVLVALDLQHLGELRTVWPTWMKHKPGLRERPWLFVLDLHSTPASHGWHTLCHKWWQEQLAFVFADCPHAKYCLWSEQPDLPQRERMLNSLVFSVKHIETPHYLKLDTDLCATGMEDWIDTSWFFGDPVLISPPWGYTKPGSMLDTLDTWAAGVPEIAAFPPFERRIVGSVAKHRRIISYCMFGQTEWTQHAAKLAGEWLPVPSQDTYLHYVAHRTRRCWRTVKMSDLGWRHVGGGGRRLQVAAAEAMGGIVT